MKKTKTVYICQHCGALHSKWTGKCDECNTWNSIIEESNANYFVNASKNLIMTSAVFDIADLSGNVSSIEEEQRYDIGIAELNRVLGGGAVSGSVILMSGEPGIGKSTLLLQMCDQAAKKGFLCLYASGEESTSQIQMRAQRLQIRSENIKLIATSNVNSILNAAKKLQNIEKNIISDKENIRTGSYLLKNTNNDIIQNIASNDLDIVENSTNSTKKHVKNTKNDEKKSWENQKNLLIIDSIQTLSSDNIQSTPGTVNQVKSCAFELIRFAKEEKVLVIIVGHITKEGQIAGPKLLEHMVDTVLSFEGEHTRQYRILRTTKNRYGSTNEIGVFEMSNRGLLEVSNPSSVFLSEQTEKAPGTCIFAGIEGSRSILLEVQSLVVDSFLATPRRATIGWDNNRLAMLIAILHSRFGLSLFNKEVYLNVAGGLKVNDTAIDLAVVVALISSALQINIPRHMIFFGEIGLSGEVRSVPQGDIRIQEGAKLGFKTIVCPYDSQISVSGGKIIKLLPITHINELNIILGINHK